MHLTPNGAERTVEAADLFFSTTDRKGVIDGANAVFCRYAAWQMDELIDQPHNCIRHPEMPAGAFALMWDRLLAGQPMAAYVKNLAHDGFTYWVFATITPLGDGFLSVRQAPCRTDLWRAADALYQQVLPLELAARAGGASRNAAAKVGAAAILSGLAGLGLRGYEEFIALALPAEVKSRQLLSRWVEPDPRDPASGLNRELLAAAIAVDHALDSQLTGLDDLEVLSTQLADQSGRTESSLDRLRAAVAAATAASAQVAATEPVLGRVVAPLSSIAQWLCEAMDDLRGRLEDVRGRIAELRMRIALARLHDETLGEFAREMASGEAPDRAPTYVQELCRALEETATTTAAEVSATNEGLRALAAELVVIERELRSFQRQLSTWRLLIPRYRLSQRLDPYTEPIDVQLRSGLRQVGDVRRLADQCLASSRPFDSRPLTEAVAAVERCRDAAVELASRQAAATTPTR